MNLKNKKLSLVIPCYNEEKTLHDIVSHIIKDLSAKVNLELVIIDDCSTDNSYNEAKKLLSEYPEIIKVFQQPKNKGKGSAVRRGLKEAKGDYIGIQDADMEYAPADYLKLLTCLCENNADVVYGSRYLKTDNRRVLYFWHTMVNKFLTILSNCFTNLNLTDMETCYKLFTKKAIKNILPNLKENCFGFEPEVTQLVANNQYKIYECGISYNPRSYDEGKKINWKDGIRAIYCILRYGLPQCNKTILSIFIIFIILIFLILFNCLI